MMTYTGKILIVDQDRAARYGHTHIDDLKPHLETFSCRHLVLLHASRRHRMREVEASLDAEMLEEQLRAWELVAIENPAFEGSIEIAGREVRIIVRPEEIDDLASLRLARDIARQIEETMQYPGQIKVTVIREVRSVSYAK